MAQQPTGNHQLLSFKERITENLSSVQIERTLDDLLFKALTPLIENSDFVEYSILELLPHIFLNQRRKFSVKEPEELRNAIFSFIVSDNTEEKIKLLRKQTLERSVYFTILSEFEISAKTYLENVRRHLHDNKVPTNAKEIRQSFFIRKNLYETCQSVIYWLNLAYSFRAMIVEKYIKHASTQSLKMVAGTNLNINQEELYRNLIIVIHKAINKFNSEKGSLTNYINLWFNEAKNNHKNAHEEGVAFQMSTSQRKKLLEKGTLHTFTLELNDVIAESVEDTSHNILNSIIELEEDQILNNLTCRVDENKVFSLITGIRYTLTPDDIKIQQESCQWK